MLKHFGTLKQSLLMKYAEPMTPTVTIKKKTFNVQGISKRRSIASSGSS
jgi:hypothetical protein